MPWSMPRGGPSSSSSRPARPMTAEARSICWTVWAREISCWLTAPTTPTLCVRRSRNAAPGRASNQCPDASTLRLSVPFFIVTETSSSASSTNSSTSAPSPRDTKNTPTTTSHSSSSLPSEYGCDLMSLCLRDGPLPDRGFGDRRDRFSGFEELLEIAHEQLPHEAAGVDRSRADMGQQYHPFHGHQLFRHMRLVFEDIEAGREDALFPKSGNQGRFIDDAATPHINDDAVGTERI